MKSFKVHNVGQKLNLRHLCEPLWGTEFLVKTVGFKKTMECVWWWKSANARREWVPYWGGSNAETAGSKGCVDPRNHVDTMLPSIAAKVT